MVLPSSYVSLLSALSGSRVLVTGGAGFLGRHIVEQLVSVGAEVAVFDVVIPTNQVNRVKYIKGDLVSFSDVSAAVKDQFCVFHVASPSPTCNNPALFWKVNVEGTENVIKSCIAAKCHRIVYTSSASVVFDGRDQENYDEQSPLPEASMDAYTKSKLAAERLILKANSESTPLFTCSIRPHGIFGPRDPHMVPAMARVGRANKSRYQIGDGSNLVDFTYVENVAFAHLLAAVNLKKGARVNGQEYFITNKQPILFWEFFSIHFRRLGYTEPFIAMPVAMMRPMARLTEAITPIIQKVKKDFKPTFTVQAINYAGVHHYYSSAKAERDFGYFPAITMDEGIDRTIKSFEDLKNPKPIARGKKVFHRGSQFANFSCIFFLILAATLAIASCSIAAALAPNDAAKQIVLYLIYALALKFVHSSYRCTTFGAPVVEYREDSDLTGSTVVVTGANKGIGFATALKFARLNARVIIACRDSNRGREAAQEIKLASKNDRVEVQELDLNSFASVRAFVDRLAARKEQIAVLVNNAGAMLDHSINADGNDTQFQTNYLGHYLLTRLMTERSVLAQAARIVNVSSVMHYRGLLDLDDIQSLKAAKRGEYNRLAVYENTKLAQVAFTLALQRSFNRVAHENKQARMTVVAVNPGAVASEFIDHFIPTWLRMAVVPLLNLFLTKDIHTAAHAVVHAALAKKLRNVGGYYFDNCKLHIPHPQALDEETQNNVWAQSAKSCQLDAKL